MEACTRATCKLQRVGPLHRAARVAAGVPPLHNHTPAPTIFQQAPVAHAARYCHPRKPDSLPLNARIRLGPMVPKQTQCHKLVKAGSKLVLGSGQVLSQVECASITTSAAAAVPISIVIAFNGAPQRLETRSTAVKPESCQEYSLTPHRWAQTAVLERPIELKPFCATGKGMVAQSCAH